MKRTHIQQSREANMQMTKQSLNASEEEKLSSVLKTLLGFTLLMIIMPISMYFISKAFLFEGLFGMSSSDSYFYAAIVAILNVHVVLALFIYTAWNEDRKSKAE